MNAVLNPLPHGGDSFHLVNRRFPVAKRKIRVAVFGSFHGGHAVLSELLEPPLADEVTVIGVATDDPKQPFTHADVRLWKYPHTKHEEEMVRELAAANDLPVFTGRVRSLEFDRQFVEEWRPDLCLMATFGQLILKRIFEIPPLGFYNFHHSDEHWPSYPGPDPIAQMVRDGKSHLVITMHEVSEVLDGGRFFARSHKVRIPTNANAVIVHRITWPRMGGFVRKQVRRRIRSQNIATEFPQ